MLTHVHTTSAAVHEANCTSVIEAAMVAKDVAPQEPIVDGAYVSAELLVSSQQEYGIALLGPARSSPGWQSQVEGAYGLEQFTIDWDQKEARCPQGQRSYLLKDHKDNAGKSSIFVRFSKTVCGPCDKRPLCTRSKYQSRQLVIRP